MNYEDITKRLCSLNYTVTETDKFLIEFLINKVSEHIKNYCNILTIPKELDIVATDMCCGEFLLNKKNTGQLEDIYPTAEVKQIKQGDTTVSYAVADNVSPADEIINSLMNANKSQLVKFRRIIW